MDRDSSLRPPLLRAERVTIVFAGQPALRAVELATSGDRVGLSGAAIGLVQVLEQRAELVAGRLEIDGVPASDACRLGHVGIARPWLEALATVPLRQALVTSLELWGMDPRRAQARVDDVLSALRMTNLGKRRLGKRLNAEHYLAGLAEAMLVEPQVIVAEFPLGQLDEWQWARYGAGLASALTGRRLLAILPRPPALPVEQAWVGSLDETLAQSQDFGLLVVPADRTLVRTLVTVEGEAPRLLAELRQQGLPARPLGADTEQAAAAGSLLVDLPRDAQGLVETRPLISLCQSLDLVLIHLEPLDGAG